MLIANPSDTCCMQRSERNGNALEARWASVDARSVPDWEAAHVFLEVSRCGSFRAAAQKLNQSVNALRRKVDELEFALGAALITRHVNGVRLTEEGTKIFNAASEMEKASFALVQASNGSGKQLEGEVRLAITEGLGTFWLSPRLVEFQRANPKLMVSVRCAMKSTDVLRLGTDLSVQLDRPKAPDLKVFKLGRMHLTLFAARSYLDRYGYPTSVSDLTNHRFVVQTDDDGIWRGAYEKFFKGNLSVGPITIRNNVSSAHLWAILNGGGIGILPSYAPAVGTDLVPLNLGLTHSFDIWLAYHPDVKRIPRIRKAIEWISETFDSRRFPWFRDNFIEPEKFARFYSGEPLSNPFAGVRADE